MIYLQLLKVSYDNATFKKRGFQDADPKYKKNFEQIGFDFLRAYNFSLGKNNLFECANFIDSISATYNSGFMYEGASMACGFNIELGLKNKSKYYKKLFDNWDDHIYMVHVGLGWSYCRIPFFSVEERIKNFHPLFRWLVIDGMGFHDAYFNTKKILIDKKINKQLKSTHSIHVYHQGIGRCLWFVSAGNLEFLKRAILSFPTEYHNDLWAGIGLASVYAVGVDESILLLLKSYTGDSFPAFAQGVCFGSKARIRANNVTEKNIQSAQLLLSMSLYDAALLTDRSLPELIGESSALDTQWKRNIQHNFK